MGQRSALPQGRKVARSQGRKVARSQGLARPRRAKGQIGLTPAPTPEGYPNCTARHPALHAKTRLPQRCGPGSPRRRRCPAILSDRIRLLNPARASSLAGKGAGLPRSPQVPPHSPPHALPRHATTQARHDAGRGAAAMRVLTRSCLDTPAMQAFHRKLWRLLVAQRLGICPSAPCSIQDASGRGAHSL